MALPPLPAPRADWSAWGAAVHEALANPGASEELKAASVAAVGDRLPSAEVAALALLDRIRTNNDITSGPIGIGSVGSSVAHGDGIAVNPEANNPGAYLTARIEAKLNPLGNLDFAFYNGAVPGSIIASFSQLDHYADMKAGLGVTPTVVLFGYGMNDGNATMYHGQQTYPGAYTALRDALKRVIADGALPIVCTTPHPHSGRMDWTPGGGVDYPAAGQEGVAADIVNLTIGGVSVPASYRHYRVNQAMRAAAIAAGAIVLDAEKYWFEAIAKHGENALFDGAEYVHPNLLGHQLSYHRAIDKLIDGLTLPAVAYAPPRAAREVVALKPGNEFRNTGTFSDDPNLQFVAGAGETWDIELTLFYYATVGVDMKAQFSAPAGTSGNFGILAAGDANTGFTGGPLTARSSPYNSWLPVGGIDAGAIATVRAVLTTTTAGTIAFQWAQMNENTGTTTQLFGGSILRARRIE